MRTVALSLSLLAACATSKPAATADPVAPLADTASAEPAAKDPPAEPAAPQETRGLQIDDSASAGAPASLSPPRVWIVWVRTPKGEAGVGGLVRWKGGESFDYAFALMSNPNLWKFLDGQLRSAVARAPADPGGAADQVLMVDMKRNTNGVMWAAIDPARQAEVERIAEYRPLP